MTEENTIKALIATLSALAGFLWGGMDGLLLALVAFMAIDLITGVIVAATEHNVDSEICFRGLCKKILILLFVAVGHLLDTQIFGGEKSICRSAVIGFYCACEGLSILENGGKLIPYPKKLKEILAQLKKDSDTDDSDKEEK